MSSLQRLCLDFLIKIANCSQPIISDSIFNDLPLPPGIINKLKYRYRSKIEWISKHDHVFKLIKAMDFIDDVIWTSDSTIDHVETVTKFLSKDYRKIENHLKFELASIYCNLYETRNAWNDLNDREKSTYLSERSFRYDPVVCFWTGICANQPWLADSYLVRAFYWAAERNFVEAFAYFWRIIERERSDVVVFRAVRAFELAAFHGHMPILTFLWHLWSAKSEDPRRQMIQGALKCTEGSLRVLENACKSGRLDIIKFLYNEATFELRHLMLRSDECYAFRTAADENQMEIVEFFLEKASRIKLTGLLLESDDFSSFRKATVNGNLRIVEIFWRYADDEERKALLTAPFYLRRDLRRAVAQGYSNVAKFLWDHSSCDLRGILKSNFFAPCLSEESFQSFKFGNSLDPFRLIDEDF